MYWSVVMAHELAHNVVPDHSSQHSYYTESLVMQYFGKIAAKATPTAGENAAMGRIRDPVTDGRRLIEVD